jgi:preprotein translocase subunit Sss1
MFTNLPADVINTVKTSIFAVGIVLYVITLIAIILNIRSRGAVL